MHEITDPELEGHGTGTDAADVPENSPDADGGNGTGADGPDRSVRLKSVDQMAAEYGLPQPDEFVGPESSRYVLDYGRPIVLADSTREQRPSGLVLRLRRVF